MNRPLEQGLASHYHPLIGAYDSGDPDVIELQIGWMKIAGFDGVLADWYGVKDHFDYPMIHERTKLLFAAATKAELKIGVVYEDQSIGNAIRAEKMTLAEKPSAITEVGSFLRKTWLSQPNWIRFKGKPAMLVFGPQAFNEADWTDFRKAAGDHHLVTLHKTYPSSSGAYDWPIPDLGRKFTDQFKDRAKDWGIKIPVAYPRFHDFYEEAGQKGYPEISDDGGATYRETLELALQDSPDAVQVATWNDWQEGTQIEPSTEFRYRDLIVTQAARRKLDPKFAFAAADVYLPLRLYRLRKSRPSSGLDAVAKALQSGNTALAKRLLDRAEQR